jgi:hypothetical protein
VSADEVRDIAAPPRTGPRHAAPRKPLFTRFHVPAGKAIALAAMPTAVLMGMGLTPTLASADDHPAAKSLTADEYKDCMDALASASASPSPSASASKTPEAGESAKDTGPGKADGKTGPSSSGGSADTSGSGDGSGSGSGSGGSSDAKSGSGSGSSSKSGSDAPSSSSSSSSSSSDSGSDDKGTGDQGTQPSSSATASGHGGLLGGLGDTLKDILTPGHGSGGDSSGSSPTAAPAPTASRSASKPADDATSGTSKAGETVKKVTGTVEDTVEGVTDPVTGAAGDAVDKAAEKAKEAADKATSSPSPTDSADASPSPTASEGTDPDDCPAATDAEGGVDNQVILPDDPWHLQASSLTLKGADYQGIVKVRTADGTVKKVLKYVISAGTDIGDLHQTVNDAKSGKTYHVQAADGSTSTIRDGDTVMYTESISGNLLGLIPITFDPEHPPPLNIPLIYFTNVKVTQAAQFGGTLHVPGMHLYTD